MAANRVKKLNELVNERDFKIKKHCNGESWLNFCNDYEEIDWYTKNILPIDEQIVYVSNCIIAKFSIPCRNVKTIDDVYKNQWIMKLIENDETKKEEESLIK